VPLIVAVVNGVRGLLRRTGGLAGAVKCCCGWVCAYTDAVATSKDCYPKGQQPYPTSDDTEYKTETECRKYCDNEYVCAWKSFDPGEGKECVKKGTEADPALVLSTHLTPNCDGLCVEEYYCAWKDDEPSACYPDAPPDGYQSSGPYSTMKECEDSCKKKYKCDTTSYDCTEDPDGPYDTLKDCEDNCKPNKHYCCGSLASPEDRYCYDRPCDELGLAEYGVYDTAEECNTQCKAPHYKCNTTTYDCTEDPLGPYTSLKECEDQCKQRYNCRESDYTCVPDENGPYLSEEECKKYCKATKYYCCGSAASPEDRSCYDRPCSELGLVSYGEYDDEDSCKTACKVEYFCCKDSDGAQSCYEGACPAGTELVGGPYANDTACGTVCKPKTYACREMGDGTKSCVEDPDGPYTTPDCNGDCDPARYACKDNGDGTSSCVQDKNGPYSDDACNGDCDKKKKYSCVTNPDGSKTCIEDPNGAYEDDTCGGDCLPKKYKCSPLPDGSFECIESPDGIYDEPTCGGQCDAGFFGLCCTDYGLSSASRKQCQDWGGKFYTDADAAAAGCPCDCDVGGGYCEQNGIPCANGFPQNDSRCEGVLAGTDGFEDYIARLDSYNGGPVAPCFGGDCTALNDLIAKGAKLTGWLDTHSVSLMEMSEDCCPGRSYATATKYRVFAYNCKKKEWEEAPNVLAQYDNSQSNGTQPGETCLGFYPAPVPPIPVASPREGAPVCVPKAANPLP
jgi:hypothetical protein